METVEVHVTDMEVKMSVDNGIAVNVCFFEASDYYKTYLSVRTEKIEDP